MFYAKQGRFHITSIMWCFVINVMTHLCAAFVSATFICWIQCLDYCKKIYRSLWHLKSRPLCQGHTYIPNWFLNVPFVSLTSNPSVHPIKERKQGWLHAMDEWIYIQCGAVRAWSIFFTNINKRRPIARPLGRGMGCHLCIQHLIDILPQFLQLFVQYLTILDCVIAVLDCILKSCFLNLFDYGSHLM